MLTTLLSATLILTTTFGQPATTPQPAVSAVALNEFDEAKLSICWGTRTVSPKRSKHFRPCRGVQLDPLNWDEFYYLTGNLKLIEDMEDHSKTSDIITWSGLGLMALSAATFGLGLEKKSAGLAISGASGVSLGLLTAIAPALWPYEHDDDALNGYVENYNASLREKLTLPADVSTQSEQTDESSDGRMRLETVADSKWVSTFHHQFVPVLGDTPMTWDTLYKTLGEPDELAHIERNRTLRPVANWTGNILTAAGSFIVGMSHMDAYDSRWVSSEVGIAALVAGTASILYALTLNTGLSEAEMGRWVDQYNREHHD